MRAGSGLEAGAGHLLKPSYHFKDGKSRLQRAKVLQEALGPAHLWVRFSAHRPGPRSLQPAPALMEKRSAFRSPVLTRRRRGDSALWPHSVSQQSCYTDRPRYSCSTPQKQAPTVESGLILVIRARHMAKFRELICSRLWYLPRDTAKTSMQWHGWGDRILRAFRSQHPSSLEALAACQALPA